MARNCARYGACVLFASAAILTGCSTGSSNMVNAGSPTTTASISATSYDFGQNIVGNPETQTVVEVTNTGTNPLTLNPTIMGSTPGFSVVLLNPVGPLWLQPRAARWSLLIIRRPPDRRPQLSILAWPMCLYRWPRDWSL